MPLARKQLVMTLMDFRKVNVSVSLKGVTTVKHFKSRTVISVPPKERIRGGSFITLLHP